MKTFFAAFWLFRRNTRAVLALGVLCFLVGVAIAAEWLAPFGPFQLTKTSFAPPGMPHLIGPDDLGRDIQRGVI
jgi:peptide/nickel transport system permease protein